MKPLPKEPLPPGYSESEDRKCVFCLKDFDNQEAGEKGLALAIMLKAVQDGCNATWLKEIAEFYNINIPLHMLDRTPARRMRAFPNGTHFTPITCSNKKEKLVLLWRDGMVKSM